MEEEEEFVYVKSDSDCAILHVAIAPSFDVKEEQVRNKAIKEKYEERQVT